MKPKTMILMVVAVACGLAASFMTSRYLAGQNRQPAADEEKVKVLVALKAIPMSTLFKEPEKFFVEKEFTPGEEPKKAIRSFDQLKDRRLNKSLAEEQFVTAEDLYDPKAQGLDSMLPQGMRAVALKVSAESIAGGFVLPHSHVDVLCTLRAHALDDGGRERAVAFSQVILQNMLVLAADMDYIRNPDKQAMLASTVTLAAKPDDATKLRLAGAVGELSLILRPSDDDKIVKIRPATPSDITKSRDGSVAGAGGGEDPAPSGSPRLGGVPDVPTAPVAPKVVEKEVAPPNPPKTHTLVIYNGDAVTKAVYLERDNGEVTTQVEKTGLEVEARPEKKTTTEHGAATGTPNTGQPEPRAK